MAPKYLAQRHLRKDNHEGHPSCRLHRLKTEIESRNHEERCEDDSLDLSEDRHRVLLGPPVDRDEAKGHVGPEAQKRPDLHRRPCRRLIPTTKTICRLRLWKYREKTRRTAGTNPIAADKMDFLERVQNHGLKGQPPRCRRRPSDG
ncbi:MAG: hypothetical protein MZU91_00010 [Desulfosudis oleivorans]|nr:hypothetical protein [Desulfosudis oleivorans]